MPAVIGNSIDIAYAISATEVVAPFVVKVDLPQDACTVELASANPFSKNVEFKIRVHPAYLPYATALTFFPCGESQQWDKCRPSEKRNVEFLNNFRKQQEKDPKPYMVSAVLDINSPAIRLLALNEGKSLRCREYFYLPR